MSNRHRTKKSLRQRLKHYGLAILLVLGAAAIMTAAAGSAEAVANNRFAWPATGHTDAGEVAWHRMNENGARAVDIQANVGTDVRAAQSGRIVVASKGCANSGSWGCGGGYGNYVIVKHVRTGVSNPLYTLYAHLSSTLSVSVNDNVSTGMKLGDIALSGSTTGAHTHFAIGTCQALWSTGPSDYDTNCTVWNSVDTTSTTVMAGGTVPGTYPKLISDDDDAPGGAAGLASSGWTDYNGDGKSDIFWYGPGTAADTMWYGTATKGVFQSHPTSDDVNGVYAPISGDFNGNGQGDIFWYGPGAAPDTLWYGSVNEGSFVSAPINVNGTYVPISGDFNGDGPWDILWYGPGADPDTLWYGTTTKGVFQTVPININGTYTPVVGDFNGNGQSDILWYGPGADHDALWYGSVVKGSFVNAEVTVLGTYVPIG